MKLSSQIEAILFYKAEPLSFKKLGELLSKPEGEIKEAVDFLKDELEGRGLALIEKDNEVMLGTDPELSAIIEKIAKEELSKDIGKAGLETLSIILYKNPVSRSEIDYIRGVNSSFIVRNLLIRGLVERIPNPKDSRGFLYRPTFELLSFLGVENTGQLPDRERIMEEIKNFEKKEEKDSIGESTNDESNQSANS